MFLAFCFYFNLFLMTLILALFFGALVILISRRYIRRNYPPLPKTLWLFYLAFYTGTALIYTILLSNIPMATSGFVLFVAGFILAETVFLRILYFFFILRKWINMIFSYID